MLIFVIIIRRELSYLPDILVPADFSFIGHSYDWWEDAVLLALGVSTVSLLTFSWCYFLAILRSISPKIYGSIVLFVVLQYIGEHGNILSHELGVAVEEVSEGIIYSIGLYYLWRFKIDYFEGRLIVHHQIEALS